MRANARKAATLVQCVKKDRTRGQKTSRFCLIRFKVEITEQSDSLCKFSYVPLYELLSDDEYNRLAECWGDDLLPHECEAVFENGEWLLNDIVFAF